MAEPSTIAYGIGGAALVGGAALFGGGFALNKSGNEEAAKGEMDKAALGDKPLNPDRAKDWESQTQAYNSIINGGKSKANDGTNMEIAGGVIGGVGLIVVGATWLATRKSSSSTSTPAAPAAAPAPSGTQQPSAQLKLVPSSAELNAQRQQVAALAAAGSQGPGITGGGLSILAGGAFASVNGKF